MAVRRKLSRSTCRDGRAADVTHRRQMRNPDASSRGRRRPQTPPRRLSPSTPPDTLRAVRQQLRPRCRKNGNATPLRRASRDSNSAAGTYLHPRHQPPAVSASADRPTRRTPLLVFTAKIKRLKQDHAMCFRSRAKLALIQSMLATMFRNYLRLQITAFFSVFD